MSAGFIYFISFVLLFMAWWTWPDEDAYILQWLLSCYLLVAGLAGLVKGYRAGEPVLPPFPLSGSSRQRFFAILKVVRTQSWLVVFLVLIGLIVWVGSPHVLIYTKSNSVSAWCTYYGLNGWESEYTARPECPWVAWIPLSKDR